MIFVFDQKELYLDYSHIKENNPQILLQELQFAQNQIAAMRASKFWKLRNNWLKLKSFFLRAKNNFKHN